MYRSISEPSPSMPMLTKECLARRLQQNWKALHPADAEQNNGMVDDSLTNLNWLQQLNIIKMTTPTSGDGGEQKVYSSSYSPNMQVNPNAILNMASGTGVSYDAFSPGSDGKTMGYNTMLSSPIAAGYRGTLHDTPCYRDPKTDPSYKPPFHYSELISMAISESKKNKLSLSGIYDWIKKNFAYYRHADPSWQNSIRHNLSLNKCFEKVPRRKDEPGKGGFWRINPEYENLFVNGVYKSKRRTAPISSSAPYPVGNGYRREISRETSVDDDSDTSSSSSSNHTGDNSPMLTSALCLRSSLELKPDADSKMNMPADGAEHFIPIHGSIRIKMEPADDHAYHLERPSAGLYDSGEWNTLLSQDIMVGGISVKAEDIIDSKAEQPSSPAASLSPAGSDTNSDDIDDIFQMIDLDKLEWEGFPHDYESGGPLDLTVVGQSINRPQNWAELCQNPDGEQLQLGSSLSTPVHEAAGLDGFDPLSASHAAELTEALAALNDEVGSVDDILWGLNSPPPSKG